MLNTKLIKNIIKGLITYIPNTKFFYSKSTGGTINSKYCYEVWIKHVSIAYNNGMKKIPNVIAELGPGDSLGIGLAGLLCGANKYYSLDIVNYINMERNLEIFDQLLELIRNKTPNPSIGFPNYDNYLDDKFFPSAILTDQLLNKSLKSERINSIRKILKGEKPNNTDIEIRYFCPWSNSSIIKDNSVDFIYSQSVLEHINDLPLTYKMLYKWLKKSGIMSHQIDFKCHKLFEKWNSHWGVGDLAWKIIKGKRPYLINREPYTAHRNTILKNGFEILFEKKTPGKNGIKRNELKNHYRNLTDEEFETSGYFVQSRK